MKKTGMDPEYVPWSDLANAIVEQAAKDYIAALRKLKRYPDSEKHKAAVSELELFFGSPWYEELTNIDGNRLMRMLKKEVLGI